MLFSKWLSLLPARVRTSSFRRKSYRARLPRRNRQQAGEYGAGAVMSRIRVTEQLEDRLLLSAVAGDDEPFLAGVNIATADVAQPVADSNRGVVVTGPLELIADRNPAADTSGVDDVLQQFGLRGEGYIAAIVDTPTAVFHREFNGRVEQIALPSIGGDTGRGGAAPLATLTLNPVDPGEATHPAIGNSGPVQLFRPHFHGTGVAGIIAAAGVNPQAQGMAPDGSVLNYVGDHVNFISILGEQSAARGFVVVNNSNSDSIGWNAAVNDGELVQVWYGDLTDSLDAADTENAVAQNFGKYSEVTRQLDTALQENPSVLFVQVSSNEAGLFLDSPNDSHQFVDLQEDGSYYAIFSADPNNPGVAFEGPGEFSRVDGNVIPAPQSDGTSTGGFDTLAQEAASKNALVVGSVPAATDDPLDPASIQVSTFSSRGAG
jgi:hypothetical protein